MQSDHGLTEIDAPPYDEDTAARILHVKKSTLRRWRRTGEGPLFYRSGRKGSKVLYARSSFWAWFTKREFRSEAEAADAEPVSARARVRGASAEDEA